MSIGLCMSQFVDMPMTFITGSVTKQETAGSQHQITLSDSKMEQAKSGEYLQSITATEHKMCDGVIDI